MGAEAAAWAAAGAASPEDPTIEAAAFEAARRRIRDAQAAIFQHDTYEGMTRDVKSPHEALLS